jgi:tRNA pseudouridine55 synthase
MALSGILNVDKPAGWTSFDIVAFVRGRSGARREKRRVGHAGTLDPAATGVLPVLIGQATRLTQYLVDATKAYEATIELGVATDTYDADGEVVARHDASGITRDAIEAGLEAFRGEFLQTPPLYSALKRDGVPLYKRARRGEAVVLEPRPVRVDELYITEFEPPYVRLHVECAKGFYVRSLAHDLAAVLGVGGMLSSLRRSRVGEFRVEEAVTLDDLRAAFESGDWQRYLYAPDEVLLHWQAAILGPDSADRLRNGQLVRVEPLLTLQAEAETLCRAYNTAGDFVGVVRLDEAATLVPEKMFAGQDA